MDNSTEEVVIKASTYKRISEYKIGSDPEVFLRDKESDEIVSAIPYVPGDKFNPYQIPDLKEGCKIQTDNVMVEFCIPESRDSRTFYKDITDCINYANGIVPSNLEVVVQASARLSREYLKDPATQKFGCDPDFDVWSGGDQNQPPTNKTNLRSAGKNVCQAI